MSQPPPGPYAPGPYAPPGRGGPYPLPGQFGAPWELLGVPGGEPQRGNRATVIAVVVAGIVIVAAVGVALLLILGTRDDPAAVGPDRPAVSPTASDAGALPSPSGTPEGLGDDPLLDALATACYVGDMQSCDDLFDESDQGSDYESYGDSCAGRQQPGTLANCTETFPKN